MIENLFPPPRVSMAEGAVRETARRGTRIRMTGYGRSGTVNRILALLVRWLYRERAEFRPDPEGKARMRREIGARLERREGTCRSDPAEGSDLCQRGGDRTEELS